MSLMTFEWREDDLYGGEGWIAKGYPNFNITASGGFGHDCIEHFPRGLKHGPAVDELLALGARWRCRVESGWWFRQKFFRSPETSWGNELEIILRDMGGNYAIPAIPGKLPEDAFDVADILSEAVHISNKEIGHRNQHESEKENPFEVESELIQNMGKWLQIGYAANARRFRDVEPIDVMNLQLELEELAKRNKYGEEGDLLHVRVHEKDMEVTMRHQPVYTMY